MKSITYQNINVKDCQDEVERLEVQILFDIWVLKVAWAAQS